MTRARKNVLDALALELEQRATEALELYNAADAGAPLKLELFGLRSGFVDASETVSAQSWNGDDPANASKLFHAIFDMFVEREREELDLAADDTAADGLRCEAWGRRRAFLAARELAAVYLELATRKPHDGGAS